MDCKVQQLEIFGYVSHKSYRCNTNVVVRLLGNGIVFNIVYTFPEFCTFAL